MEADDLIAEGYTNAWIHWADLQTDDEDVRMVGRLILDAHGTIIARQIYPPPMLQLVQGGLDTAASPVPDTRCNHGSRS